MDLTQESVLSFLLDHGGKAKNSELLSNFRSHINCSDPEEKQHNRDLFKKLVNSVAVVKQIDEVKFVVVKKRYQDFVKDVGGCDASQKAQMDESFSYASPDRAESARRIYSDIQNNNAGCPSKVPPSYSSDANRMSLGGMQERLARNVRSADATTVRVLNISGDRSSGAGKSGAVFAVIAVKSPAAAQDGPRSQVHPQSTSELTAKVSARPASTLNPTFLAFSEKDASRETQSRADRRTTEIHPPGFPEVRPQSKTTRQADDAEYSDCVPLEPLAHEWLVKCASGMWGQIHALLLRDSRLAQRKDFMSGFTALHWAAKDGNSEMVRKLMDISRKRGVRVDVNSKAHGGYTPLHIAAIHGHAEVVVLLVQKYRADVNERDNDGKKASHYLEKGAPAEVRALLGGLKQRREKTEDEEYREQMKGFNTISKLFHPHIGKKQKTATKFAHD